MGILKKKQLFDLFHFIIIIIITIKIMQQQS